MINNIQLLRAFAAINVVYFHIIGAAAGHGQSTKLLSVLDGWGRNGVDVFFVISGFVILHTQMRNKKSVSSFLKSRMLRIVPIYWLVTTFVIAVYALSPTSIVMTPEWVISSYLFGSMAFVDIFPIVYVGWTLEWEMIFYLIFSTALLLKSWRSVLLTVGLMLAFVSAITESLIVIEFFFGMVIAHFYNTKKIDETKGILIFLFGLILLVLSIDNIGNYKLYRAIVWGIPAAFIVLGLLYMRQIKSSILVYLGDASYSIYLVQVFVIPTFYKFSSTLPSSFNNDFLSLMCLVCSISVGCLMHSFIEKPITNKALLKRITRDSLLIR